MMKVLIRSFIKIPKMRKFNVGALLILTLILSCATETINLSPIGSITEQGESAGFEDPRRLIVYSSEITNLISSFPKFRNQAVNAEVSRMKYHLKDYIGAMEAYNAVGRTNALKNFERSYKRFRNYGNI